MDWKTTYTLAMAAPGELKPTRVRIDGLRVERMRTTCPEMNKFLHTVVGHDYRWGGREDWGRAEWYAHVNRAELETWVAYVYGTPAGYFELLKERDGSVQIVCFGLLGPFIGRGLGGHLLTDAVERAWALGAGKVWLRTCTHDHPHALLNYQARGFRIAATRKDPANKPTLSIWGTRGEQ